MSAHSVLKSEMSSIWDRLLEGPARKTSILWVVFFLFVAFATYVVLRIHVTYKMQQELALNKAQHQAMAVEYETFKREYIQRLESIEQTLFGEVLPKQSATQSSTTAPRPSRIEVSQQNFNKEMRARLERFERRLYSLER
jgi:hypothetical protein